MILKKCFIFVLFSFLLSTFAHTNSVVKIAFTADQGTGQSAVDVLQLIKDEGADLLMLQGDFGYSEHTAAIWNSQLDSILGANFPVIGVVGNHENHEWSLYKQFLSERADRVNALSCSGDIGVKANCQFGNVNIVQVAAGIRKVPGVLPEDDYPEYISERFENSSATWRICSWHKNQTLMQVGGKSNATGWDVYQRCLDHGAVIVTGHEHHYSRTFLLNNLEQPSVAHRESEMQIEPGATVVVVSGLGGKPIREQVLFDDWWAAVYTRTQNATHGALFCSFGESKADCYFKDLLGGVPDSFTLMAAQANANGSLDITDTTTEETAVADSNIVDQSEDLSMSIENTAPMQTSAPILNTVLHEDVGASAPDSNSSNSGQWDFLSLIVLMLFYLKHCLRLNKSCFG